MSERDDEERSGGATLVAFAVPKTSADHRTSADHKTSAKPISFDRHELSTILRIYGRMVAAGEWRDYAIDHLSERAVFSIFRRTSETPLYRVEKEPKRPQGAYAVVAHGGYIMKRGHDLAQVLKVLDKQLKLVEA